MSARHPTENELRCACKLRPLLAKYGRDANGDLFVHVKIFKAGRIFGEMIFTHGIVRLRCRECHHWHRVLINQSKVTLDREDLPEAISLG